MPCRWRRARRDVDANANARVALCLVLSIETDPCGARAVTRR